MRRLPVAAALAAALAAGPASAAVVQVNSAGALGANDQIAWGQLGAARTVVSSPAAVTSTGGLSATVADNSGNMERRDEGNGWVGGFPSGSTLLWNQVTGNLTITFAQPVFGVGALISSEAFGNFTSQVVLAGGLGTFTVNGSNRGNIPYLGVLSDAANITAVTFSNISNGQGFAIGNLDLLAGLTAVPEPASAALLLAGLGVLGLATRRRPAAA